MQEQLCFQWKIQDTRFAIRLYFAISQQRFLFNMKSIFDDHVFQIFFFFLLLEDIRLS